MSHLILLAPEDLRRNVGRGTDGGLWLRVVKGRLGVAKVADLDIGKGVAIRGRGKERVLELKVAVANSL